MDKKSIAMKTEHKYKIELDETGTKSWVCEICEMPQFEIKASRDFEFCHKWRIVARIKIRMREQRIMLWKCLAELCWGRAKRLY